MVQKYQNEIPPIFYYGISTKTSEKDLKIPNLQALTLGRIIKITLYYLTRDVHNLHQVPLVGLTCGLIGHHLLERDHVFVRLDADLYRWVGAGGDKRVVSDATLSWT